MALSELTSRDAVLEAIKEFDEIGRDTFLAKYGFGKSSRYLLELDGREYDSKAILGAAYQHQYPERPPLRHGDFNGGTQTINKLESLGFVVRQNTGDATAERVRQIMATVTPDRLPARQAAEQGARDLLNGSVDDMDESAFRELFRYLNADSDRGKQYATRFAPAFHGAGANMLVRDIDALRSYTRRIWSGSDDEALDALGEILADHNVLYGASASYPTALLYLRDRTRWPIWLPSTDKGLRALGDHAGTRGPANGLVDDYLAFAAGAENLREEYDIPPELLDYVLWSASAPPRSASTWLLQANPKYYDIDRALRELPSIQFTARQHYKQMRAGDRAFIWKSGPAGGIVATGLIDSDPAERPADEAELPYFLDPDAFSGSERRVDVVIDTVLPRPLSRQTIAADPALGELAVFGFSSQTIFAVTDAQRDRLEELVADPPPRYWWVNQRDFARERGRGYVTAPLSDKGGGQPAHWRTVGDLGVGDVILHYSNKHIRAVGRVTAPPRTGGRPEVFDDESLATDGYFVPVEYADINDPVPLTDIPEDWRRKERGPFQSTGGVNQGYLYPLSEEFVAKLARRFQQLPLAVAATALEPGRSYREPPFEDIVAAVEQAGMTIRPDILRRYHLSLKTRGFVVLSGISGTGKTWLAELYANAVGAEVLVVPVAPNWTTNEDLLGYLNPLDNEYRDTEFSRFLRAAADEDRDAREQDRSAKPHHLVLDEMNLARVEYYFAKFLSAMELRMRNADAGIELAPTDQVPLPGNLKFVGTVNVDETTHGFADKVYDRAQLIELTIDRDAVVSHLAGRAYAEDVADVWEIFKHVAPFAFRVLDEISEYVDQAAALDVPWETALDEELLQKVLPKIKGTDLRLPSALKRFGELSVDRFPLSNAKAVAMERAFSDHGFTSYF